MGYYRLTIRLRVSLAVSFLLLYVAARAQPTTNDSIWLEYASGILKQERLLNTSTYSDYQQQAYLEIMGALLLLDDADSEQAIAKLKKAATSLYLGSHYSKLYHQTLAKAYLMNEQYDSALAIYSKLTVENKASYEIYNNIGFVLFNQKRYKEAKSNLDKALFIVTDSIRVSKTRDFHRCNKYSILANMYMLENDGLKQRQLYDSSVMLECGEAQLAHIYYSSIISSGKIGSPAELIKGLSLAGKAKDTWLLSLLLKSAMVNDDLIDQQIAKVAYTLASKSEQMKTIAYEYLFSYYVQTGNVDSSKYYYQAYRNSLKSRTLKKQNSSEIAVNTEMTNMAKRAETLIKNNERKTRIELLIYMLTSAVVITAIAAVIIKRIIKKRRNRRASFID